MAIEPHITQTRRNMRFADGLIGLPVHVIRARPDHLPQMRGIRNKHFSGLERPKANLGL